MLASAEDKRSWSEYIEYLNFLSMLTSFLDVKALLKISKLDGDQALSLEEINNLYPRLLEENSSSLLKAELGEETRWGLVSAAQLREIAHDILPDDDWSAEYVELKDILMGLKSRVLIDFFLGSKNREVDIIRKAVARVFVVRDLIGHICRLRDGNALDESMDFVNDEESVDKLETLFAEMSEIVATIRFTTIASEAAPQAIHQIGVDLGSGKIPEFPYEDQLKFIKSLFPGVAERLGLESIEMTEYPTNPDKDWYIFKVKQQGVDQTRDLKVYPRQLEYINELVLAGVIKAELDQLD